MKNILIFFMMLILLSNCRQPEPFRNVLLLNGSWEIARTASLAEKPTTFGSTVPVPGLVDMALPAEGFKDSIYQDAIFWYRTTFVSPSEPSELVLLKINKARYHTRVYLNDNPAGENVLCFTPSYFDLAPWLNPPGQANELVIAVGCKNNLPDTVTNGNDFEKINYIPGIYDDVQVIFSGYPYIRNVQVAPDPAGEKLLVQVSIDAGDIMQPAFQLAFKVRESVSGKIISSGTEGKYWPGIDNDMIIGFTIPMKDCKLWSPEDPFLYRLELSTGSDEVTTRFGMRSFSFDKDKKVALLNGKPYYMRGTNVCIFRFFEDPARKDLPWDARWTTELHRRFRDMHFNSIRYCIGFPPEKWYEVADSLGFLIQDEYPIWTGGEGGFEELLPGVTASGLAGEYRQWMQERWNHPCMVIWDANNESVNDTTGKAYQMVRDLDLSDRPWDNGWAPPMEETDCIESHPYLYVAGTPIMDLLKASRIPENDPNERAPRPDGLRYNNPIIINEYDWIWLNRDGSPTTLTDRVYQVLFPEADTPEKRFEVHAKNLAMITEYWRAHRQAAAVMYFCGLGYSRSMQPRGQTSDDFIDLDNLVLEPHFVQYVKPAFNPVGVMLDLWNEKLPVGTEINLPVYIINDTYDNWNDSLSIYITKGEDTWPLKKMICQAGALESVRFENKVTLPAVSGTYTFVAEIQYRGESIKSIREVVLE